MAYPVAYRPGFRAPGFEGQAQAPANDNIAQPANDNYTKFSRGAQLLARSLRGVAKNTPYGRALRIVEWAPTQLHNYGWNLNPPYPFPRGGWQIPQFANGWEFVCGQGPWFATLCGPFIEPGAVSCDLTGQAANPAGLCTPVNTFGPSTENYSVVWEYLAFGTNYRFYGVRYHKTALDPATDPNYLPMVRPGHAPKHGYAPAPSPIPPLQPIGQPLEDPYVAPYRQRNENNVWHQEGPLTIASAPTARPIPRKPPDLGVKERKFNKVAGAVYRIANAITESDDLLESIWKAIPWKLRTNPRCITPKGKEGSHGGANMTICPSDPGFKKAKASGLYRRVRQTPQTMLKDVYKNWNSIDWGKALYNQQQSEAADRSIGRPAAETARNFRGSPYVGGPGFRGFWGPAM